MDYEDEYFLEEDKFGMTVTAGSVTLDKNEGNLIGISIGGGGKYCPCLYVVQVFDNTAASRDGTLQSGDELTGVNTSHVKGKSKTEVAQLIQRSKGTVTIHYNKLHPDPKQGKSLDIVLKKVKHRFVETMSSSTADAFGLSRAILCNDSLVRKLDDLTKAEEMYRSLIDHAKLVFKAFFDLIQVYKRFGDVFCSIGVREIQMSANEAFNQFGEAHRNMEKYGIQMLKRLKPILGDLGTYLHKAIPDTRLTIKRYADVKFEYLSYCLKVKEMDDEEIQFAQLQEPLYRVETGNYEYRLILRCRQDARALFARLRSDVLVKLELLDSKHVQHLTSQLTRLVSVLATYHGQCQQLMHDKHWFPIELDLQGTTLYNDTSRDQYEEEYDAEDDNLDDDDDVLLDSEEATESNNNSSGVVTGSFDAAATASNEELLGQLENLNLSSDDDMVNFGDLTGLLSPTTVNDMSSAFSASMGGSHSTLGRTTATNVMNSTSVTNQTDSTSMPNMAGMITSDRGNMSSIMSLMDNASGGSNSMASSAVNMQNMLTPQQNNMVGVQHHNMMGYSAAPANMSYIPNIMPEMSSNVSYGASRAGNSWNSLDQTVSQMTQRVAQTMQPVDKNTATNFSGLSSSDTVSKKVFPQDSVASCASNMTAVKQASSNVGQNVVQQSQGTSVAKSQGLSQLSQELINEPSVDKQLEAFKSPTRKTNAAKDTLSGSMFGSSYSVKEDELQSLTVGDGSCSESQRKEAKVPSAGREGIRKEMKKINEFEDVNLLD